MAQVIQGAPNIGALFGSGFGQGLSTGLEQLAQRKMHQFALQQQQAAAQQERDRYAQAFAPYLGKEAAGVLSSVNPEERKLLLQNIESLVGLTNPQQGPAPLPQSLQQQPQELGATQEKPDALKQIQNAFKSPAQKIQEERLDLEKKRVEQGEKKLGILQEENAYKKNESFLKEVRANAKGAKEGKNIIENMRALEKTGKLDSPLLAKIAELSGLEGLLLSPESQAFQKASASFINGIKEIFGGRVTNLDLEAFMKTIPTLRNTPEGRYIIGNIMKATFDSREALYDETKKIIKQNNGKIPDDLEDRALENAEKRIDSIYESLRSQILQATGKSPQEKIKASSLTPGAEVVKSGKRYRYIGENKYEEI